MFNDITHNIWYNYYVKYLMCNVIFYAILKSVNLPLIYLPFVFKGKVNIPPPKKKKSKGVNKDVYRGKENYCKSCKSD